MLSYRQCQQSPRTTTYSNYDDAKGSLDRAVKQIYETAEVKLCDQKLKRRQSRSRLSTKLTKELLYSESLTRRDSSELHELQSTDFRCSTEVEETSPLLQDREDESSHQLVRRLSDDLS